MLNNVFGSKLKGLSDMPIEDMQGDLFHVDSYVEGLCDFIKTCNTPMTISIQGDWGSGKTSMMNMIESKLGDEVIPVKFNTWMFSQFELGNDLAFSMIDVLLKALKGDDSKFRKFMRGLTGFGKNAITIVTEGAAGGIAAEEMSKLMNSGSMDYAKEIQELKGNLQKAIDNALTGKAQRVVVFVDDLDRLQPQKAVELLEVMKIFLDCRNCVFILAVDYNVVTQGIKQKYGADMDAEKGRSFFDKIIQLPFKMPVAHYQVSQFVEECLNQQGLNPDKKEIELFKNLISTSVGFNPRSMKRLFNTFQLLDTITNKDEKAGDKAVRQRILFAIICAQLSFERLYQYLAFTPSVSPEELQDLAHPGKDMNDSDIRYFLNDDNATPKEKEKRMHRIERFMRYFIKALDINGDDKLQQEELDSMKQIIGSSTLTSLGNETENTVAREEASYRKTNREYANIVNSLVADLRLPGDAEGRGSVTGIRHTVNGEVDSRYSDMNYQYSWRVKNKDNPYGVTFICAFSRGEGDYSDVSFFLYCDRRRNIDNFYNRLGGDPLDMSLGENMWFDEENQYAYQQISYVTDENKEVDLRNVAELVKTCILKVQNRMLETADK